MSDITNKNNSIRPSNLADPLLYGIQTDVIALFGLLVLTIFVFFIGVDFFALIDPDEPRYASCAKTMLESGNWTIPYFNGVPRLNKPPLFYWLVALSFKVFGVSELSARLPSLIFGIGGVVLTFFWARSMWGRKNAFWAGFVLAVSPLYIIIARLCITDMTMFFFLYVSLFLFYRGYEKGRINNCTKISIYITFAAMFLTKGHVGILVFFIVICAFLVTVKDFQFIKQLWSGIGLLVFAGIALPWSILFVANVGISEVIDLLTHETYGRFVKGHQHPEPFYFFVGTFLAGFCPWSFFIPLAFVVFFKNIKEALLSKFFGKQLYCYKVDERKNDNIEKEYSRDKVRIKFFFCWFLGVIIFFSMSSSKLFSYILPMAPTVPFIFIIMLNRIKGGKDRRINNVAILLALVLLFCFSIFIVLLFPKWVSGKYVLYRSGLYVVCCTFCICTAITIFIYLAKGIKWSKYSLAFTNYLILIIISLNCNVFLNDNRSTREVVYDLLPSVDEDYSLSSYRKFSPSLSYYSGKNVERIDDKKKDSLKLVGARDGNIYVYMVNKDYRKLKSVVGGFGFRLKGKTTNAVILTTVKE